METPPSGAKNDPGGVRADLVWLLDRLPAYLEPGLNRDARGRRYFGSGDAGEDCIRSMGNLCFALGVLAEREGGERHHGLLTDLLWYLCDAHRTGEGRTARGGRWGLEWQSSWWAAKMALGARLVWGSLATDLRGAVERVVAGEADRHLGRDAPTGLFRDTKAEETAWDAEILAVGVNLMPAHPNAPAWRVKLVEFLANTFSTPGDRISEARLDGARVRDAVYTCNVHADYTLENHGAYHFCYVASCLVSKSWTAYAFADEPGRTPGALDHGVAGVWGLAAKTFLNDRFAYISGQDWARYAYGEYFIVAGAAWLGAHRGDADAWGVLRARVRVLRAEAGGNADGSFFGRRMTGGAYHGQMGKYETDCFACVALALKLLASQGHREPTGESAGAKEPGERDFVHISPESQTCFYRSQRGLFSFSWTTLDSPWPMVLLVPAADDSLAEWRSGNGVVAVTASGLLERWGVGSMRQTDDGITVAGHHFIRGRRDARLLVHECRVSYDAASDTVRSWSKLQVKGRVGLIRAEPLAWCVPNDLFNGCVRMYHTGAGAAEWRFDDSRPAGPWWASFLPRNMVRKLAKMGFDGSVRALRGSAWINIDNRIGFVALHGRTLCVRRTMSRGSAWSSLHFDVVTVEGREVFLRPRPGANLCETEFLIHLGTAAETRRLYEQSRGSPGGPAAPASE
jgi:hypothetical protein